MSSGIIMSGAPPLPVIGIDGAPPLPVIVGFMLGAAPAMPALLGCMFGACAGIMVPVSTGGVSDEPIIMSADLSGVSEPQAPSRLATARPTAKRDLLIMKASNQPLLPDVSLGSPTNAVNGPAYNFVRKTPSAYRVAQRKPPTNL
jgi:hypothetical protein